MRLGIALLASSCCLTMAAAMPVTAAGADARPLFVEHLTTAEGLPQGTVYSSLQDSAGFMWFGTEGGVVRYDGHDVHRYTFDPANKSGLPGNFVFGIVEDRNADLWLAIKGAGLARWDRKTDTFTAFRHDPKDPHSISSNSSRTLAIDARGRLWLGLLDAGIDVIDPQTGAIEHLRHRDGDSASLIDDRVYALFQDRTGDMWIGTNAGIDRWDAVHDLVRSTHLQETNGLLPGMDVQKIVDDPDGTLWVGTFDGGVYHLDPSGRTTANYRHANDDPGSLRSNEVHALLDDHKGQIWVGTADGLDALNRSSGTFTHYAHDKADSGSLTDSFTMSLYEDHSGLVWIGTRAGGVNRWNSHSWELGGRTPGWLEGKMVTAFADGSDGHLWVGTLGGGLYSLDVNSGEAGKWDDLRGKGENLGDARVMSLLKDKRGTLWIGTWGVGLKAYEADGHLQAIAPKPGDPHGLSAPGVAVLYQARKTGLIWVGMHGGGANIVNPETRMVRQLPFSASHLEGVIPENVTAFTEDAAGNVWIGSEAGGLTLAQPDGTIIKSFRHDAADLQSLSSDIIYALSTDPDGRVWISTDSGLNEVLGESTAPSTLRFERFSLEQGLSSDTVYAAVPDWNGALWLSGNAGLMRFDLATHAIKTFHREDGLQAEEFNSGAFHRMTNGRLAFGGTAGINVFDPARLSVDPTPPRIALTGVEVLGVPLNRGAPNWTLRDLALDYHASVVSFDFAALDFKAPNRNRMAYRVSGLTDKWIDLNSQRRVTLTNLGAGDHTLEVRAASGESVWSATPYRLNIHKAAAPWASNTAYALYALALAALIAWLIRAQRLKLSRALQAQQQLESEVDLRTRELSEANRQLIIASEAKSDFLARMGHELRTPMNGVVGMTELLARAHLPAAQARQVGTIRASAQTLLQILNDLLDLSKAQAGKIELERLPIDLTQLIEESVAMFAGAAEAKALGIIVCPAATDEYRVQGDPLRIRQILMNLIGNAIKFTQHGEIVVRWDVLAPGPGTNTVRLSVSDTGIGISETSINKIFDPFTQADETTTRRFGGTGLGLSICQQLAELMGGAIDVTSRPDCGSTFTVLLPLAVTHEPPSRVRSDPRRMLVVHTRRPAFADAYRGYSGLLGFEYRKAEELSEKDAAHGVLHLVDADTCPTVVNSLLLAADSARALVIGSPAAIRAQRLEARIDEARLLRAPVTREVLEAAVAGVLGDVANRRRVARNEASAGFSQHVMVVEDDAVNAAVAQGYLAELGCTCVWVEDGEAAVARERSERFDLILMDLNMPGLDGFETARRIRGADRAGRVPIIALTANSAEAFRPSCLEAGMDDIMTKPYTLAQCAEMLTRWSTPAGPAQLLTRLDGKSVAELHSIGGAASGGLYVKLVALFEKSVATGMQQLGQALQEGDQKRAQAAAHKLKGASANVGASEFSRSLQTVETSCAAADLSRALTVFEQLAAALPGLLAELRNMSIRATA
jgi:signal transduction histidine kinase/ligand-binding sensor domain-containing protein/CheY-like chemotaxis protein/HPt (histidine-containing phosphotransfer) domain-containing protein